MKEMIEANQFIKVVDYNPNILPTIILILAGVYILYAIVSVKYNKKRLNQLKKIKMQIAVRHDAISVENTRLANEKSKVS